MVLAEEKRLYTEAQNAIMLAQNAIMLKSLETSLKTLEDLCRPLANGEMHNLTVLLPAMKTINDFTDEYFAQYENIPSMLVPTARVCELRATVARILSTDTSEAIRYYNRAEASYERRYHASVVATDKDEVQRSLIGVKISEGDLYIQRKEFDAAESRLNQAKAFCDEFLDRRRNGADLERYQAEIFHLLGQVNLSRETDEDTYVHNLKVSEANFEDSGDLLKKLVRKAEGKEKHRLQRDLARNYGYLGDLYLAQGNISKAERSYEESEDERLALYNTNQMDAENRFQYARGIGNFGSLERNYGGHLDKAIQRLKEAEAIQLSLAKDFPEINTFSVELAYTQNSLAEVLLWQAIDHEDQFVGYLKQAGDAAMNAAQRLRNDTENTHELAWSLVTQAAIAMLNNDGTEAAKLANQAENLIVSGDTIAKPSRSKRVTLALAASLQGNVKVAYQALEDAVSRGENTPVRFEKHGGAGFKALNNDPIFGKSYRELCRKVRNGMGDK